MGPPLHLYISEGIILGLSLGATCLATCGPIYLPFIMGAKQKGSSAWIATLHITLGRFLSYLVFGIAIGFIGKQIKTVPRNYFTSIAYIGLSVLLIYQAVLKEKMIKQKCKAKKWQGRISHPFVLGIVTGINFCPSFLILLTRAFQISGILASTFLFLSFFVGSSVFIVPLALAGYFTKWDKVREIARMIAILIGIWFLGQGIWIGYKSIKQLL